MSNTAIVAAEAAASAATEVKQGFYKFFEIVFKNLAVVNEFIARGFGSSIADEKNAKGFSSVFRTFHTWLTTGSSAPAPKPKV
ncbi:hypothetical protein [Corynebacterium silvaticum]|uniref:Uncharacterized protein n=1 Tax=Corynebacterium silvaticum TaxID=2320431 RepID=A0A7Y4LHF8_9CORY|nr:hypothetical protein [Corynebacterium silvaticum]ARU46815.1 hypothetical protein CBE74_10560 [Corynebacterium silvaticum]MBH5300792.1 hypothetical protein [Corynebacterium silvaticum]NOM64989.1 hypothetical protein [Corynebacterium silvaticum]NON70130.1 hypothetical protein [Corynebacterium silvaticum]TFA91848.1 hypothetical protein EU802_08790 [Corynebacterium silvaticum]